MIYVFFICFLLKLFIDFKLFNFKVNKRYLLTNVIEILVSSILLYTFSKFSNYIKVSYIDAIFIFLQSFFFITFIFNFKYIRTKMHNSLFSKCLIILIGSFVISGIIEIGVCNFRFFQTLTYTPKIIELDKIENYKNKKFEIKKLNLKINNVYIDTQSFNQYNLTIKATDEGNALYYQLPTREISDKYEKSKYISLNLSGKSKKILLTFDRKIILNRVILNAKVPLYFNSVRFLIIAFSICFIYAFYCNSYLFKKKLCSSKYKLAIVICLIAFNIMAFCILGNGAIQSFKNTSADYYNQLTSSLKKGKVYIQDPDKSEKILNKLKNPYDINLRAKELKKYKASYLWDAAFYNGHYYVYFGVVPAIIFYLPLNALFNIQLPTAFVVLMCTLLCIILITILLYRFVKLKYKNCSIGVFILLDLLLIYCTGLEYFVKIPNFYGLPIVSGLMFTFLGLNLYFSILTSNRFIKTKLTLGSLSLALVAGCRPQLLLGSLLIIPILVAYFKKNGVNLKKKDYIKYIFAIMIPYIIVASLLMYYNYIRFGSPFDFGANYNLTTNDMTVRGFQFRRIPLGIFMYLFNPVTIKGVFPFIGENALTTSYMGITIYETVYGGLLTTTLIYLITLFLPKFKKIINNKLIYNSCFLMLVSAFLILIVDTQMAGILARYLSDFSWLFGFITVIILLAIENKEFKFKNYFYKVLVVLIILALIYQFFYSFCSFYDAFKNDNLSFWLYFKYLIEFWL